VVPAIIPDTSPEEIPIVAIPGALLLQVPPAVASARVRVRPTQSEVGPVIGDKGLTVMLLVIKQPAPLR
jgi:hypothetical protein